MKQYTEKAITEMIQFLVADQILGTAEGKFPTLLLNKQSVEVLTGQKEVWMATSHNPKQEQADFNAQLFNVLRTLRKKVADEDGVPPYVLFSDATLRDICRYFPKSRDEMLDIKGIGPKRYEQYGELFLGEVTKWLEENPQDNKRVQIQASAKPGFIMQKKEEPDEPSHMISYASFQSSSSNKDIAVRRDLTEQTTENHLFKAFDQGFPLAWGTFFNTEQEKEVSEAREQVEEQKLSLMKEKLPETYTYRIIKAVLVKNGLFS